MMLVRGTEGQLSGFSKPVRAVSHSLPVGWRAFGGAVLSFFCVHSSWRQ